MGTEQNITVSRAININQAVDLLGESSLLPFEVAYKLGNQGTYVQRIVERKNKEVQKLVKAFNVERTKLINGDKVLTEEQTEKITELNGKLNEDAEAINDKEVPVKLIKFKSKDFMATEDTTDYVEIKGTEGFQTRVIKKGSSLVPIAFFKLMGDLIEE